MVKQIKWLKLKTAVPKQLIWGTISATFRYLSGPQCYNILKFLLYHRIDQGFPDPNLMGPQPTSAGFECAVTLQTLCQLKVDKTSFNFKA